MSADSRDVTDAEPFEITKRPADTDGEFVGFEATVHPSPATSLALDRDLPVSDPCSHKSVESRPVDCEASEPGRWPNVARTTSGRTRAERQRSERSSSDRR